MLAVKIAGLGSYLPARVVSNAELAPQLNSSPEWIVSHTGIANRHVAAPDEWASTLGAKAAEKALAAAGATPDEIGLVILGTTTPDYVGCAATAGLYPLHIWLPKAHPVAPAPASALLSGILTKSGVFGMIVICSSLMPGNEAFGNALLVLAVITMFLGALLALFSVDLKRTLACSSMSQIGFITVGLCMMVLLGEHGSLSSYGVVMHMMNHSLIKLVLFMAAGVIYLCLGNLRLLHSCPFRR